MLPIYFLLLYCYHQYQSIFLNYQNVIEMLKFIIIYQ